MEQRSSGRSLRPLFLPQRLKQPTDGLPIELLAYDVSYNATAAADWTLEHCDHGAGKRFGDCETDGGVVLQERAGEAVLLAVGFDVRVVAPDGETDLTVVVGAGG